MPRKIRILAVVWLILAAIGAIIALRILILVTSGPTVDGVVEAIWFSVGLAILAFWVLPLTVATLAILAGKQWARYLLAVHSLVGGIVWLSQTPGLFQSALQAIQNLMEHGPHWGGFPEMPLWFLVDLFFVIFSGYTFYVTCISSARPPDLPQPSAQNNPGREGDQSNVSPPTAV